MGGTDVASRCTAEYTLTVYGEARVESVGGFVSALEVGLAVGEQFPALSTPTSTRRSTLTFFLIVARSNLADHP